MNYNLSAEKVITLKNVLERTHDLLANKIELIVLKRTCLCRRNDL